MALRILPRMQDGLTGGVYATLPLLAPAHCRANERMFVISPSFIEVECNDPIGARCDRNITCVSRRRSQAHGSVPARMLARVTSPARRGSERGAPDVHPSIALQTSHVGLACAQRNPEALYNLHSPLERGA